MRDRNAFMGSDLKGRTIGIVGIGNVGRRIAELCRGLLGMQVIACDPYLEEKTIAARGATVWFQLYHQPELRSLPEVGRRAVVLVTHDGTAAAIADRIIHIRDGRIDTEETSPLTLPSPPRVGERVG